MKTASVYLQIGETAQVFYSPSYQVPVFYFPYDNTLTAVGSGEGPKISYAEHPITGLPVSFLHPCQTAAVIGELYANSPFGLLLKWLGAYWQEVPNVRIPAKFFSILNREPLK